LWQGALSFALLDYPRALPQLDQIVRVHASGLTIGAASNQQVAGTVD
jgi:hypothetical protein